MKAVLAKTWRSLVSLALIAAITSIDLRFNVNSATAAFSYLLLVLGVATRWGLAASIAASFGGMLCYNYFFLPPVGTFSIGDPQNWVALIVFLITAVTASQLSSSGQQRAREALARQQELERLHQFSRALMLLHSGQAMGGQIAGQVLRIFDLREVAFFESWTGVVQWAGVEPSLLKEDALREAATRSETRRIAEGDCLLSPVTLGGQQIGSIGVCGAISEAALHAIASLAAIVLERGRTQEVTARAEAARQNEQLKSTLLDALAHEFKTPLTSIKAAITSALSRYSHPAAEEDLLSIVDEEANRMNALVTESIEIARLEAGHLQLRCQACAIGGLIQSALAQIQSFLDGREVQIVVPPDLPPAFADPHLIGLVLRQLLNNAVKYSVPMSPIRVAARTEDAFIEVAVTNRGKGIPEHEQASVFEKFYRGQATRDRIPGTGLGLTIARDIVEAHHGRIWITSRVDQGATVAFALPMAVEPANL